MQTPTYSSLVEEIINFINLLIPLLFSFLFVFFIWKMTESWILHPADEKHRQAGRQYLIAAVISLVVMVGVWGIVTLIRNSIFS